MLKNVSEILLVLVERYVLTCLTSWQASIIGAEEDGLCDGDELGCIENVILSLP